MAKLRELPPLQPEFSLQFNRQGANRAKGRSDSWRLCGNSKMTFPFPPLGLCCLACRHTFSTNGKRKHGWNHA
jgi:hypothetical protein